MNDRDLFLLLASSNDCYYGKSLINKLYKKTLDLKKILNLDIENDLKQEEIFKLKKLKETIQTINLEKIQNELIENDVRFVALCDEAYPVSLRMISDSSYGLFYKGNLSVLKNTKSVGIVGTRNPTNYGINNAKDIASLLAEYKVNIISGFASGIDTSAHVGALKKGKTVAVLGTGVDVIFPKENKDLYERLIKEDNLIISEYYPGITGSPWNFPQRNRIISALSDAVLVIEGGLQSGALITARFAIKYGKPLFALPGPIDSPASNGPNILIKSGVAELLTSVDEILEKIGENKQIKLGLKMEDEKLNNLSENEKIVYKLLSSKSYDFDILVQETKFNVQELLKCLSMLELKGFIEKTQEGGYVRN